MKLIVVALLLGGCTIATVDRPYVVERQAPDQPAPETPARAAAPPAAEDAGSAAPADAAQAQGDARLQEDAGRDAADAAPTLACLTACAQGHAECGSFEGCDCPGTCSPSYTCIDNRCGCPDEPAPCAAHNAANPGAQVPAAHGYNVQCSDKAVATTVPGRCARIAGYWCCP